MTALADRLNEIRAIADTSAARIDLDDMLVEVVRRIRVLLDADTVAILLRDQGTDDLVARAASGLEEEVWQGVRVPMGRGFAGSIASTRRPGMLHRVDSTTVTNPILWRKGIQELLGVPLLDGDAVIGVVHVGRLDQRPFQDDDVSLLQLAAERIAGVVQSRQLAVEAAAARLLERGLQPTRLPTVRGLELAGRYISVGNRTVGGDWYDAFLVPSGELWLVVGDVAGHGLQAAVVMGRIKSAFRAYALLGVPPETALEMTDRKIRHFEIGAMVTMVCAVLESPHDRVRICSAGHLPPVLALPGHATQLLDLPRGVPLGTVERARESSVIDLPTGAALLLYTDGLVERKASSIEHGLTRLKNAVVSGPAEAVCTNVLGELIGDQEPIHDVALLSLYRAGP